MSTSTSSTTTTTPVIIAAPTSTGLWPYYLVFIFVVIAAWSLAPSFVRFLSTNSISKEVELNEAKHSKKF
jgi:hypothetical protein